MSSRPQHLVAQMTWDQVAERLSRGAGAVLPIGAGAKEHGLHLPMNTDQLQAEWLAGRMAERFDMLVWPTLVYGHYPAFVNYAGSCSLAADTFERTVRELVAALLGYGARPALVLDTGISTLAPVDRAIAPLRSQGAVHLKIHAGARYRTAVSGISEQVYGSHADELETSRMLALAPDVVAMSRAEGSPAEPDFRRHQGPMTPDDPEATGFCRSGVFGDPTLATAEKGAILLAAMLEDVLETAETALAAAGRA